MREHTHMKGQKHKKTKCLINFDSLAHTTVFAAMLGRTRTQMKRGKNFFGRNLPNSLAHTTVSAAMPALAALYLWGWGGEGRRGRVEERQKMCESVCMCACAHNQMRVCRCVCLNVSRAQVCESASIRSMRLWCAYAGLYMSVCV